MLRDLSPMARSPVAFSRPSWTSSITRWPLARCSLLALCLACSDDGPKPPALQGAPGDTRPSDAGAEPVAATPILLEAESGQVGSDVSVVPDGAVTYITAAVNLIRKTRDPNLDLDALPLDDPKTYQLLQRGETKGVFQLEGEGIRNLLVKLKPDRFGDMVRPPLETGEAHAHVHSVRYTFERRT